ncbi:hypothetical protein MRB53_038008 [Persea americana]|nr:hypothetical protein MRB53_038008 [Persea americana]
MASPGLAQTMLQQSRPNRNLTTSPPPRTSSTAHPTQTQPLSKRDKRRALIADRLADMVSSFADDHAAHYYAQLSGVQCDINLVLRADPYADAPLEDSPAEIAQLVAAAKEQVCRARPIGQEGESSFAALSGRCYARFVDEVNGAMEERDRDLTQIHNEYQDSLSRLQRENLYRVQLAHEEHAVLSKELRQRLIVSVNAKRAKLLKDKEHLDIADSNALLLHPNQFSIGNPASPGGPAGAASRKTRHTRLRPGEGGDDGPAASGEGNKRKRKAAEDAEDSPAPHSRMPVPEPQTHTQSNGNGGGGAALRDARLQQIHNQFEAPLYSIANLYSDRELTHSLNIAHAATVEHFERLELAKSEQSGEGVDDTSNRTGKVNGIDHAPATANRNGASTTETANGTNLATASPILSNATPHNPTPSSAQTITQQQPTARSLRSTHNPLTALAPLASRPPPHAQSTPIPTSKTTPPGLPLPTEAEIAFDTALMGLGYEEPEYKFVEAKCLEKWGPLGVGNWWAPLLERETGGFADGGNNGGGGANGSGDGVGGNAAVTAAAVMMARQGSGIGMGIGYGYGGGAFGGSALGGAAMSRTTSEVGGGGGVGGVGMRRTASGMDVGRRAGRRGEMA